MLALPAGMQLLERGWLSSNNVLFVEGDQASLVDSGYVSHADQTIELLRHCLDGCRLVRLVNTHSHSDHIGGNAALAREFGCRIVIPEQMADMVSRWDQSALLLGKTGQRAERFGFDALLRAGEDFEMGGMTWRAHAAPGHDMSALVFHCQQHRLLISGDALWRNGFGLIFADLFGDPTALSVTRATLEAIGRLEVDVVIPGHGPAFVEFDDALERAFARLASFEQDGDRHARHAARVIFSFGLMETRRIARQDVAAHLSAMPLYQELNARFFKLPWDSFADWLIDDLIRGGTLRLEGGDVMSAQ